MIELQRILRSLIQIEDKPDHENINHNFHIVTQYEIEFLVDEDLAIYKMARDHILHYREGPTLQDLMDRLEAEGDPGTAAYLTDLSNHQSYIRSSFESLVARTFEAQREQKFMHLLKEAAQIARTGLDIDRNTNLKGVADAISHIVQNTDGMIVANRGTKLRGDITTDHDDFMTEVRGAVENPTAAWGVLTGIVQVDEICKGLKRSEVNIHAAFSGSLKTTWALNWVYYASIFLGRNVYYVSLEMSYKQVRRILKVMHSTHWKFTDPVSKGGMGWPALDYRKVRDGDLTEEEIARMEYISKDMDNPDKHGVLIVDKPVRQPTVADVRFAAEAQHRKTPLELVVIDYLQLVKCKDRALRSTTERQNDIARDAKDLAMNFNTGEGIGVVALWQINSDGYKHATKVQASNADGKTKHYDMTHLSWAGEARNAADIITYTFVDDNLKEQNEAVFGCIKNRDNPVFDPVHVRVSWPQRRIETILGDVLPELASATTGDIVDINIEDLV